MFFSVFYGWISYNLYEIAYANGGHQLPIKAVIGRTPQEVEGGHGVVLSIVLGFEYHQAKVVLETGEHLFNFTGGVTEAYNVERQAFGEGNLA